MSKITFRKERNLSLDELSTEFDKLLTHMQTLKARKGVEAAFNASPIKLARAAVTTAKKHPVPARKRARRPSSLAPQRSS